MQDLSASIILLTETVKQTLSNRSLPSLSPLAHSEDDPPPDGATSTLAMKSIYEPTEMESTPSEKGNTIID